MNVKGIEPTLVQRRSGGVSSSSLFFLAAIHFFTQQAGLLRFGFGSQSCIGPLDGVEVQLVVGANTPGILL